MDISAYIYSPNPSVRVEHRSVEFVNAQEIWVTLWDSRSRPLTVGCAERSEAHLSCDRHGSWLAGESPAMAPGRREHVGEGKGARRNGRVHLKEEGNPKHGAARTPMRDLKEAGVQNCHLSESEPLEGVCGRARCRRPLKPKILSRNLLGVQKVGGQ